MFFNYNGTNVYYLQKPNNDQVVNVFLHGWQRSGDDFLDFIQTHNIQNYIILDFPPFGQSDDICGWNLFTYVNMLISLLDYLQVKKINLIAHSFGGRVAIIISAIKKGFVNKLILLDSAGLKTKKSIKKKLKIGIYKLKRKLGLNVSNYGSEDYKKLSPEMKETFKSIINTNLEDYAKAIETQTLIIFGENDRETPIYMAKKLNKLIKKSRLEIIKNSGHFCFIDNKITVGKIMDSFLKEE